MKAKTILEGCGVGILVMRSYLGVQFSPYHLGIYRNSLPNHTIVWGLIIDLAVISLLAALLFGYLEERDAAGRSILWALAAAELVAALVALSQLASVVSIPHLSHKVTFAFVLIAALALRWFRPLAYQAMTRGVRVTFALVGCSIIWMAPVLLYRAVRQPANVHGAAGIEYTVARLPERNDSPGGRRVVWLLFDELSYDQTFIHHFPGLALPAFDQFKRESVNFADLNPAGYYTEKVIPSLFTGNIIDDLKSNLDGDALLRIEGEKGWHRFDAQTTLFAEAKKAGWTTGVVGWSNPYCRILAGTLDSCYWKNWPELTGELMPEKSALYNAMVPITSKVTELEQKSEDFPLLREQDFAALMRQSEKLIRDERISFVFIHLLVPHPPGIFDRKTGQIRDHGTYIDNLALADRSLSELMTTLKSTASLNKTTVIVCSDHSWRVPMWRSGRDWTKEEEVASQGKFDPHPVLMIHFPGQTAGVDVTQPFQEIKLHAILKRMLNGGLQSSAELESWLKQDSAEKPGSGPQTAKNAGNL